MKSTDQPIGRVETNGTRRVMPVSTHSQQSKSNALRMVASVAVPAQHIVRFENVSKTHDGQTHVVRELCLEVRRGEFLTMLGPSGSGKTTCLMMLAGFESVSSGEIFISDRPISHVPPNKRGIGMVFQNYALFPHMTVGQNLSFPLEIRGFGKSETAAKVKRALEMVRLPHCAERRPVQLSGGQQQRVALARALVFEPELVLMDEPLGALDKNLREEMQYEIKRIHQNLDVSVVYVTHDQTEALTMSDRVAVINHGMIQQIAPPATLYDYPENTFVAGFVGENNLLPGVVHQIDGDYCKMRLDHSQVIVRALRVGTGGAGSRATLSLRPERVCIDSVSPTNANTLKARISDVVHLGDQLRIRLVVGEATNFVAKVPNVSQQRDWRPGVIVTLGWQADDCRALDGDPADRLIGAVSPET